MGKQVFQALFSADNPFRRKPEPQLHQSSPSEGVEEVTAASPRKRKQPVSSEAEKKQKKDEESPAKKRKKRKRDELEVKYEEKNLGVPEHGGEGENGSRVVAVGRKRKGMSEENETKIEDSFDDESKLLRTVFVGNLPLKTKRKTLLKEFSAFGEIESIRLRSVPLLDTKVPRKGAIIKGQVNEAVDSMNAYIVFKDEPTAQASLLRNMSKFGVNHIRVDMACPPRKKTKMESPLYNIKRTIFVGNLPFDVKDEEVYQLFCEDSELGRDVEAIRVVRDPHTSLGKGIAYILLKSREAANIAIRRKNFALRDRTLRICHARSDPAPSNKLAATPQKRKSSDSAGGTKAVKIPSKRAATANASESTPSSSSGKPIKSGLLPYQGLRASNKRGGIEKKSSRSAFQPTRSVPAASSAARNLNPKKIKNTKRPAVAARKAKTIRDQGKKRKQESSGMMTAPDFARPRKKARSF